jgi:hypothetical protein
VSEAQEEAARKGAQLADKEAIIELVEQEVAKIKDGQEEERRRAVERETAMEEMAAQNEQIMRVNE